MDTKPEKLGLLSAILPMIIATTGYHSQQGSKVDIIPHCINLQADSLYQQAMTLMESSCDIDSTRGCIRFLDKALAIDSLNPDYYGIETKLLSEMGELDFTLYAQTLAMEKNAITSEYLFQLGLLQTAKDIYAEVHESFGKNKVFLQAVLRQYPDSLGTFILAGAANSFYENKDSLSMRNIDEIRKHFPERLLEMEMTRGVKPHSLVDRIRRIKIEKGYNAGFDMDSLVEATMSKG